MELCCMANECSETCTLMSLDAGHPLKTETRQSMSTCGCHHAAKLTSESEQAKVSDLVWALNS